VSGLTLEKFSNTDDPFVSGSGKGIWFKQQARFDDDADLSRWNFLHDGSGATVYVRAQYTEQSGNTSNWVSTRRLSSSSHRGITIGQRIQGGNRVVVSVGNGTDSGTMNFTPGGITPGDIHTFAVKFTSTGVAVSVDGGPFGTEQSYPETPAPGDIEEGFAIASDPNGNNAIDEGVIEHVAVTNQAATDNDAAAFHDYAVSVSPSLSTWSDPTDWGASLKHWWDGGDSNNLFSLQDKSMLATPNGSLRAWTDKVGGEDLILDTAGGTTSPKWRATGSEKIQGADFNGSTDRALLTATALSAAEGLLTLVEARTSAAIADPFSNDGTMIRYYTDGDWRALSGAGSPRSDGGDGALTDPKTVAVSFGSSEVEIWVDQTATTSTAGAAQPTDRFTIGRRGSGRLDGVIGQVCLLDRTLTQEDVNLFHEWTRGLIE
jgi:hypothetical protein